MYPAAFEPPHQPARAPGLSAFVLVVAALFAMVGCGGSDQADDAQASEVMVIEYRDNQQSIAGNYALTDAVDVASDLAGFEVQVPEHLPPVAVELRAIEVHLRDTRPTYTELKYLQGDEHEEGEPALFIQQTPPGEILNPEQPTPHPLLDLRDSDELYLTTGQSPTTTYLYERDDGSDLYIVRHPRQSFRIIAFDIPRPGLRHQVIRDLTGQEPLTR